MAQALELRHADGERINLYDLSRHGILDGGHDVGRAGAARQITLRVWAGSSTGLLPLDDLRRNISALHRLLGRARQDRAAGLGRTVTLRAQPDTASAETVYDVLGGEVVEPAPWNYQYLANHQVDLGLILDVEPYARGVEVEVLTGGATPPLHGQLVGITHRYLHYTGGTVFSVNLAALMEGSLWQSNKFSASPTVQTPTAGDALYFGNNLIAAAADWDRIIMGIRTAGVGTYAFTWEFWNGTAWTAFTPDGNSFKTTLDFDTAARLGAITWTPANLTGWVANAVNTVTAFWVRARLSSLTSMTTVPAMCNGPARSHFGIGYVPPGVVKGDVPARGQVHLTNPGATALAGARAGIATGLLSDQPPPFEVPFQAADMFIPSGDITAAVATDANATLGERVELTSPTTLSDRGLDLDGVDDYITAAVTATDKIDLLHSTASGNRGYLIEAMVKFDAITFSPTPVISRWDSVAANRVFWLGIDKGKPRAMMIDGSGNRKTLSGNTALLPGVWYLLTLEGDADDDEIQLKLNGQTEARKGDVKNLRTGVTTALRVGKSVGFAVADSRNGSSAEVFLEGVVGWVWLLGRKISKQFPSTSPYAVPTARRADTTQTRWLIQCQDNAATTVVVDSAVLFAAAQNGTLTGAGNTSASSVAGPFIAGAVGLVRALGLRLPQCFGEEYAGDYRVFLAASPAAALASVDDVEFRLQFSVGDSELGYQSVVRRFPFTAVPTAGYYVLDMGVVRLPPAALYEGHRGSGSGRNQLALNLFISTVFVLPTVIRVSSVYLVPLGSWYGEYSSFRLTYDAARAIAQNTGVLFDDRGPEPVIAPTTTGGYTVQERNPYQRVSVGPMRLPPGRPAWLFALPLRGADDDYLFRGATADKLTPRLHVVPQAEVLVAP